MANNGGGGPIAGDRRAGYTKCAHRYDEQDYRPEDAGCSNESAENPRGESNWEDPVEQEPKDDGGQVDQRGTQDAQVRDVRGRTCMAVVVCRPG